MPGMCTGQSVASTHKTAKRVTRLSGYGAWAPKRGKPYLSGNTTLNFELCRLQPDSPWGFPARDLEKNASAIYQERAWCWMVWTLLGTFERWYFGLPEDARAARSDDIEVIKAKNPLSGMTERSPS